MIVHVKYQNWRAFEKHLESAGLQKLFAGLYLVVAREPFDRRRAQEMMIAHLGPDVRVFDGEKVSLPALENELYGLSLFSKKQLVVVQSADSVSSKVQEMLEAYFAKQNPSVYLLLIADSLMSTTTFYKKAEKAGVVLDLPAEKPWEKEKSVLEWILSKGHCGPDVAQALVKQVGVEQMLLEQEINKLLCYIGERDKITLADLAAISSRFNQENVWQLGEAIFNGDGASALRVTKALLQDGVHLLVLLKQLRYQFHTGFQISQIIASGGGEREVSAQFPQLRGQMLARNMQMNVRYGEDRMRRGLIAIDDTEIDVKNSGADLDLLAERLLIKLLTR